MTNYVKSTNFATKDNLASGDPLKIVKGTEINTEFDNIATAVATKTDNATAAITGGSITGITDLAVADGGTGASTASGARTNLGAAASGANSDITSITGLTTALTVAQGGTGVATLTANNVVLGNGTSSVQFVAPSTAGNVLVSNGTTWISGGAGVSSAVAGNGISVSASTGAVTFAVACPSYQSIGSYSFITTTGTPLGAPTYTAGSNYSNPASTSGNIGAGTWKCMSDYTINRAFAGQGYTCQNNLMFLFCRVS
jgi:hypothetical protein